MPSHWCSILTFESHGRSFFHGVKFSVQTTSLGRVEYLSRDEFLARLEGTAPVGGKLKFGLKLLSFSTKFKEAQNNPDNALVSIFHDLSTLQKIEYQNAY
jgi:hypothetical protein